MKTYLKLVFAGSIIFFLFSFGLSYGNRLAMSDHVSLSRSVVTNGITKEVAETTKIVADANKTQAEADAIIGASVIDFGKGTVLIALGVVFVLFLMFLVTFSLSALDKFSNGDSDS